MNGCQVYCTVPTPVVSLSLICLAHIPLASCEYCVNIHYMLPIASSYMQHYTEFLSTTHSSRWRLLLLLVELLDWDMSSPLAQIAKTRPSTSTATL